MWNLNFSLILTINFNRREHGLDKQEKRKRLENVTIRLTARRKQMRIFDTSKETLICDILIKTTKNEKQTQ